MVDIERDFERWQSSLCPKVELGGLLARNPVAHKWKAPFRSLVLRETTFWRMHDLLKQAYALSRAGETIGGVVLLRSAFETLAVLAYLNDLMVDVVAGRTAFDEFSHKTSLLLLGSRDGSTEHSALNVLTLIQKCEGRHPGLAKAYGLLSESAHPNCEGLCQGYSRIDHDNDVVQFHPYADGKADMVLSGIRNCLSIFEDEYNVVWPRRFDELEEWITAHDAVLESVKS